MAVFSVPNVKISGLAACVPKHTEDNENMPLLTAEESELFIKTVGIRYRRVAQNGITSSDLCLQAAERLIADLAWKKEEINILIFITQTPDYIIPNTSSLLQNKLQLPKTCMAFDINLGCSGYVYGLSVITSLLQNMPGAKALLLVGDISTKTISHTDKSTAPLFSDAGTATALEFAPGQQMHFSLQTDGTEFDDIIISDGGFRNPVSEKSFEPIEFEKGVVRNALQMKLDGVKIFNFSLREIALNINNLLSQKKIDKESIDFFVFHQANLLILESIRRKLKLAPEKVPYSLYDFGNTSSATIPLTMLVNLKNELAHRKVKLLIAGFGVGLSWGSAYIETENILFSELIEI